MNVFTRGLSQTFSPKNVIRELITLRFFDYIMLLVMLVAQVAAYIATDAFDLISNLSLVVGIFTILNLILMNRGRLTNYLWGTIGTIFWWIIALQSHLIGDIFSQTFYLIMQFVGIYFWQKNLDDFEGGSGEVAPRKITAKIASLAILAFVVIYGIVLATSHGLHGQQIFLDATLLPLGILSMILMTYGYRSQWLGWILIDSINVIIWFNNWNSGIHGGSSALGMFVLQITMLLNCIYGTYLWFSKKPE
ncbi:nicotinamide riboside transporter PnuC [Lactococcus protaetiae]|uniref:Nicotinamide mononucleotide transporter n=1 Tax=Lactococcus protaetiae TaxID=2592653 RepID=A0A514Z6Q2_9LACT|nr:nicotinamide riboside transporter PnuC [Lactococcus protaetiae]MCL2114090.1 nicotinamide riboside transporter PnuC [Streptococcaceae bacterium]QDK70268.1 nicotinamide mononucleotide transporter [Lactococcus protaetiae]